ncbi:MAG TPA: hypothetical protein VGH40_19070 [Roseiarcus sp.]
MSGGAGVSHLRWTAGKVCEGRFALAGLCLIAATLALGGCVDNAADLTPTPEAHQQFTRREGVSIAKASVAIISVDGAPASVAAQFRSTLETEARARDIAIVPVSKARYLVRGYLSADATSEGVSIEYVWDVFTKDKQRAQRLNDVIAVPGTGDDPWASGAALTSVAAKSADDLAAYLSNTPEAVAVAAPQQATAQSKAVPAPAAAPLAYAASQ